MVSYEEACSVIRQECKGLRRRVVEVGLMHSLKRVLAHDVVSDTQQPPFDNAAMDGIAIRHTAGVRSWNIAGEISAGNYTGYSLGHDTCVRIMTGAKVPPDADTVIPVEDLREQGASVELRETVDVTKGQHIRYRGSDLEVGLRAVPAGTLIGPNHISMLAACGQARVSVFERFRVGVLVTGDELIPVEQQPYGDKIRATNLYALCAAITDAGHEACPLGIVGDDRAQTEAKLSTALESDIDVLLTTGGVSVGKYDYIKELCEHLGVETKFWRVKIKPGKPVLFGTYTRNGRKKLVFGLPGNPVSALVTFKVFVSDPLNSSRSGNPWDRVCAELTCDIRKKDARRHFVRGILRNDRRKDKYFVQCAGSDSSGNMAGLCNANCLIVVEEGRTYPRCGEMVECIRM